MVRSMIFFVANSEYSIKILLLLFDDILKSDLVHFLMVDKNELSQLTENLVSLVPGQNVQQHVEEELRREQNPAQIQLQQTEEQIVKEKLRRHKCVTPIRARTL